MDQLLENKEVDLPDIVDITEKDIDDNYKLWLYWRALDKKFLPSEIEKQSLRKLSTILTMDNIFEIMIKQDAEKNKNGRQR